jgi:hypothetical protein
MVAREPAAALTENAARSFNIRARSSLRKNLISKAKIQKNGNNKNVLTHQVVIMSKSLLKTPE